MIRGKNFSIKGKIKVDSKDGVIVAQGGTAHGFSLYVKEGKLQFAVRRDGSLQILKSESSLPGDMFELDFSFKRNGKVKVLVNAKEQINGKVAGALTQMPADGLSVGKDDKGNVGDYEAPFTLEMNGKLVLEIE